jgi:PIN domain nuclease of toxin-antitoxin system
MFVAKKRIELPLPPREWFSLDPVAQVDLTAISCAPRELAFAPLHPPSAPSKAPHPLSSQGLGKVLSFSVAMLGFSRYIDMYSLCTIAGSRFKRAIDEYGIRDLALDSASSARAMELPPIHNDPCDRWILATAITFGLSLMSADPIFPKYGLVPIIW